jgi:uncharacterized protein (DUF4415 family)
MSKTTKDSTDPDNPIWTKRDFQRAMHFPKGTTLEDAVTAFRKARGPQKAPKKVAISIRLQPDIIAHFKKGGAGWQGRMEEVLQKAAKRGSR